MGRRKKESDGGWCAVILLAAVIWILARIGEFFTGSTDDGHNALVGGAIVLGLILLPVLLNIAKMLHDSLANGSRQQWRGMKGTAGSTKQLPLPGLHVAEHRIADPISQSDRRLGQMYLEWAAETEDLKQRQRFLQQALEHLPDDDNIQARLEDTAEKLRREKAEQEKRLRALELADIDRMRGIDFEHYVGKLLTYRGFQIEITPGSGDFGVDLVAEREGEKWAIQCKRRKIPVSLKAVQEVVAGRDYHACDEAMVVTNNHFAQSAVALAKSTECELVDRNVLADWILDFQTSTSDNQLAPPTVDEAQGEVTQRHAETHQQDTQQGRDFRAESNRADEGPSGTQEDVTQRYPEAFQQNIQQEHNSNRSNHEDKSANEAETVLKVMGSTFIVLAIIWIVAYLVF